MRPEQVQRAHDLLRERDGLLEFYRREKEPGEWWKIQRRITSTWLLGGQYHSDEFGSHTHTAKRLRGAIDQAFADVNAELELLGIKDFT